MFLMSAIDDFRTILSEAVARGTSLSRLVAEAGADISSVSKWMNNKQKSLNFETVARILDHLGARIEGSRAIPGTRDVCFVDARTVPAGENQPRPEVEDYLAVPLVDEVGAGPSLIPQGELLSWFLVYRHQDAVRYRRDLIAVQIGKHSTSMIPTLSPRDIVLVDRQDRDVMTAGRIMLVMDPEGAGMIKRVAVEEVKGGRDWRVIYYSDNAARNPPMMFSLREDFLGDWERAVVGRVVWAWSDVSAK